MTFYSQDYIKNKIFSWEHKENMQELSVKVYQTSKTKKTFKINKKIILTHTNLHAQ